MDIARGEDQTQLVILDSLALVVVVVVVVVAFCHPAFDISPTNRS
jgi:hypothetical protein